MEQKDIFLTQRDCFRLIKRVYDMKLAICDDDNKVIEDLKPNIYNYSNTHRFDLVIDVFNSGESLISSSEKYDIIIMDYKMGNLNGLDTVRLLRSKNCNSIIIFLTNYPHFIYEAFEVNTFRFFKKPINNDKLINTFDDYFKMYGNDYPLLLKCNYETVKIDTKDIVYLEADGKNCNLHLENKTIRCSRTMASISKLVPRKHFYKVCRSYIINFNYIEKYNNENIYFKNGENVHISRNYLTAFKMAYKNYSDLSRKY